MYQPIVRFNISRDHLVPNPKRHGWSAEGPPHKTLKGARTTRARLAKRYPDLDTGIQAPDGHLMDFSAGTRTLGTYRAPPPPRIKKRRLVPRAPKV